MDLYPEPAEFASERSQLCPPVFNRARRIVVATPQFVISSAARDLHLLPSGRYPGLPFNPKTKGAERILGPFILPSREGNTLKICSYSKKCAIFFPVSSV